MTKAQTATAPKPGVRLSRFHFDSIPVVIFGKSRLRVSDYCTKFGRNNPAVFSFEVHGLVNHYRVTGLVDGRVVIAYFDVVNGSFRWSQSTVSERTLEARLKIIAKDSATFWQGMEQLGYGSKYKLKKLEKIS